MHVNRTETLNRAQLQASGLHLGYNHASVVHDVSVSIAPGKVTALIGPNGSGKSTVLRSLARLHPISSGEVTISSAGSTTPAAALSVREFARTVTLLSQSRPHPSGLSVREIVAYGRHPHRRRFASLTTNDRAAIDQALELTGTDSMADRSVDQLSGGELQRVWLATCLAQETGVLLLDEPTNHLDLRYQAEILDLMRDLADDHGTAVGVVLHDLNHAAAVADDIVLLSQGRVRSAGTCEDVFTANVLTEVYGLPITTRLDEDTGMVRIEALPRRRRRTLDAAS
ncbi:iron complex transport system ATP-binding protein [Brevibacterium sp. 239c]|nr:iron complex transport system ATP-binding protein [Brevibacterium sp. 239c]